MAKKLSFKKFYQDYLKSDIKLKRYQKIGILLLVIVVAGFVGWLYEFLLVWAENGQIYAKGGNFLPWMNIYAIGAPLVVLITYKFRRYPWAVFLLAVLATGIVELIGGWLVYTIGNGARYWNYDTGPWAFGSINGFVCPLSVTIFGIGSLILMYFLLPLTMYISTKMTKKAFLILSISLFSVVMADEIYNMLASHVFGWPDAMEFYRNLGLKYPT